MLVKLRKIRKQYDITIYDMAQYLNITPSFYSQIENEKRKLYCDTAIHISFFFGILPNELFEIKEED